MLSKQTHRRAASVVCLVCAFATGIAIAQPGGMPPANVVTAKAIEREITSGHTFVGTVMPKRISTVGSAVDGRVVDFKVNLGDRVKKADPLAQLLTKQLEIELE